MSVNWTQWVLSSVYCSLYCGFSFKSRHQLDESSLTSATLKYVIYYSLPDNLPKSQINRLQQIHNCLVRTVVKAPKSSHITPILRSLHWLKINERVEYSITCVGVSYRWYRLLASRIIEVVSAVAVAMSVLVRRRSLLILTNTCSVSRTTTGVL